MSHYTQLTREERYQIYALKTAGHNQAKIAQIIGRHKSTVSRELSRNCGLRGYRPRQANNFALTRCRTKAKKRISHELWRKIERLLSEDWSPEQVSGWLRNKEQISVSHEWIYQYILRDKVNKGRLYLHLRCKKKKKKRYGSTDRRGQIKGRVSIEDRPHIVDERSRIGDWEADTVIGKQGGSVLVTLVERKSRFTIIGLASNKTAERVKNIIVSKLKPLSSQVQTLTYDNGKEFALHLDIAEKLDASGYFAHPYHSWERGTNENTNGLIRQYFPKRMDLSLVTESEVKSVMNKLNNRPRKCLDFKTPNQVFRNINY